MHTSNYERFKAFYSTPSFWLGDLAGIKQFPLSVFNFSHLDHDETALELPAIPVNTVLGKRAEYFYQFCIQQSSNYELVVANLQIQDHKRTIGELDYIIREKSSGKLLHIELVYKFYCYDTRIQQESVHLLPPISTELSRYVGPNKRDNFVYKFDRLVDHQLPLLYHDRTVEQLKPYDVDVTTVEQRVCFLAHLFIPPQSWNQEFNYINKKCIAGYYLDEFAFKSQGDTDLYDEQGLSAKTTSEHYYYLPEKYAWKMKPHAYGKALTHSEAVSLVSKSLERGYAPLIWKEIDTNVFESFFVVK